MLIHHNRQDDNEPEKWPAIYFDLLDAVGYRSKAHGLRFTIWPEDILHTKAVLDAEVQGNRRRSFEDRQAEVSADHAELSQALQTVVEAVKAKPRSFQAVQTLNQSRSSLAVQAIIENGKIQVYYYGKVLNLSHLLPLSLLIDREMTALNVPVGGLHFYVTTMTGPQYA